MPNRCAMWKLQRRGPVSKSEDGEFDLGDKPGEGERRGPLTLSI